MKTTDEYGRLLYDAWRADLIQLPWHDLDEPRKERWCRIAASFVRMLGKS